MAVSIASVVTAAPDVRTRPFRVVLVGLGRHHAQVIEQYLCPVGLGQYVSRAHGQAFLYRTCALLHSFLSAGKWVGNAEYPPETQAEFCVSDDAANMNGILFNVNLNGGRKPCR
jgi:hypothetical protein